MSGLARIRRVTAACSLFLAVATLGYMVFEFAMMTWLLWLAFPDMEVLMVLEGFARSMVSVPGAVVVSGFTLWWILRRRPAGAIRCREVEAGSPACGGRAHGASGPADTREED